MERTEALRTPSNGSSFYNALLAKNVARIPVDPNNECASAAERKEDNLSNNNRNAPCDTTRTGEWVVESIKQQNLPPKSDEMEWLSNQLKVKDEDPSYFLLCSKLDSGSDLKGVANIPWLKVFDFDRESRNIGLLSGIEKCIKSTRNLTISTSNDVSKPLSECATDWYFPLGFSDRQDTIHDSQPSKWYSSVKNNLENQYLEMNDFCLLKSLPVFLILWYSKNKDTLQCLNLVLLHLYSVIKDPKRVILCTDENPSEILNQFIYKDELLSSVRVIPIQDVCYCLAQAGIPQLPKPGTIYLPRAINDEYPNLTSVEVTDDILWIRQFIELLPIRNLDEVKQKESMDAGKEFVRGGIITWDELAMGNIAVNRDAQKLIYSQIQKHILDERRSLIIKILHAPGGGGTTFARQLLWYLHTEVPCGVVQPSPMLPTTHLVECVEFLFEKTVLPVVLLIDGTSDFEIEQLYGNCNYAIVILHVQRYIGDIKNRYDSVRQTCYLPGSVSQQEAQKLCKVYSTFSPSRKEALKSLTSNCSDEKLHIYEYGLTAFNHEFKGVKNYVNGYMELQNQGFTLQALLPWQKVVAFLSLVMYYGQSGLLKAVFHHLIKPEDRSMYVSFNDLNFSGQQFVIESNGEWKINYYIIAKEILEQILLRSGPKHETSQHLSVEACSNLHELVIDFILMLKEAMKGSSSDRIVKTLADTILRRDYKDMLDINDERKSLSRLLENIPLWENRIKILQELSEAFPDNVEFRAHLGRLHNLNGDFASAQESLKYALELRTKARIGSPDNMRARILHMLGFAFLRRAKSIVNDRHGIQPREVIPDLLHYVKEAIKYFNEGRRYATYNLSYGYIGEVRARLFVAGYVHKHIPGGCLAAFNNTLQNVALSQFIRESHSACDQRLAECQRYTSDAELKKINHYLFSLQKFHQFYKGVTSRLKIWSKFNSNIPMQRSEIASLKMQYNSSENVQAPSLENVNNKRDVDKIIRLYEKTIQEIFFKDLKDVYISLDMHGWLEAIRHPLADDHHELVNVLHIVERWKSRNELGFATFYLYVIYFVLAMYYPGQKLNMEYIDKCKELRQSMKANTNWTLKKLFTQEWLAVHDDLTIRKLVSRNKLGEWDKDKRFWKDPQKIKLLQVCAGTVTRSSHPLRGSIALTIPFQFARHSLEVYFLPIRYGLVGNRYSEQSQRVEFFIGFNYERGAEALSVRKLERSTCKRCRKVKEIITLHQEEKEKCMDCIQQR
ncbi:unnamed protein product [Clavelina lepadiformis]